jgi:phage terminase large subunit-like protein
MGPTVFAAQMMLDPKMDSTVGFLEEWLQFHDGIEAPAPTMNNYMLVDPANERKEKKSDSDYTAAWMIGLSADGNLYILDMFRDRIGLEDRVDLVFDWHRKWKPKKIGYEQYGLMADIAAIRMRQKSENYRFTIVELGGRLSKRDRILGLEPLYAAERIILPRYQYYTDKEGTIHDLVQVFIQQEYKPWPACRHDDLLDAKARIVDEELGIIWPRPIDRTTPLNEARRGSHWAQ